MGYAGQLGAIVRISPESPICTCLDQGVVEIRSPSNAPAFSSLHCRYAVDQKPTLNMQIKNKVPANLHLDANCRRGRIKIWIKSKKAIRENSHIAHRQKTGMVVTAGTPAMTKSRTSPATAFSSFLLLLCRATRWNYIPNLVRYLFAQACLCGPAGSTIYSRPQSDLFCRDTKLVSPTAIA